jgi:hypothetical protein
MHQLEEHKTIHLQPVMFECRICSKKLAHRDQLESHLVANHPGPQAQKLIDNLWKWRGRRHDVNSQDSTGESRECYPITQSFKC